MIDYGRRCVLALLFLLASGARCPAYSIFTHEQLTDLTWNGAIRPLLSQCFPGLSEADLRSAHAYAYGGCAIQDLEEVLGSRRPTFRSYNWAVRSFLPRIAYAESVIHRGQFQADASGEVLRVYEQNLAQADFQIVWNQYRRKPGLKTFTVALLLRLVPKVGPLADAKIRIPSCKDGKSFIFVA